MGKKNILVITLFAFFLIFYTIVIVFITYERRVNNPDYFLRTRCIIEDKRDCYYDEYLRERVCTCLKDEVYYKDTLSIAFEDLTDRYKFIFVFIGALFIATQFLEDEKKD